MSKPGLIYRGIFKNVQFDVADNSGLQQDVIISILDTETTIDDSATETIVPLQPSGSPVAFSAIDNDEDKYHVIRGKQLEFVIHSGDGIDISTFADGGDKRFLVEYAINDITKPYWKGFLDASSLQQDFMPDPNEILLVAKDGLDSLSDIPLTKFDGTNPKDEFRIADFLAWALSKTGLSYRMHVAFNLQPVEYVPTGTMDGHWVKIEYNSGASVHYFLDLGGDGFYDVPQPSSPPPFPSSVDFDTLTKVAEGPASFALHLVANYPGWINGIQNVGAIVTATGVLVARGMGHIFDKCYLWSKTFEKEISECEDCFSVIQKILGEFCYLEQHKCRWYIINEDEKDRGNLDIAIFNEDGSLREFVQEGIEKNIGVDLDMSFMNDDAIVSLERALSFIKETFNFILPKELICNSDFDRGDFIADLPDEVVDDETLTAKSFEPECWEYEKNVPPVTQDSEMYIKRLYNANDYEKERFLHMSRTTVDAFYYARCIDKIPMQAKDKFTIGVSYRYETAFVTGSRHFQLHTMWIRLYADDGTFWNLHASSGSGSSDPNSYWVESDATWGTNQKFVESEGEISATDFHDWQSVSVTSAPLPRSGKIEVLLLNQDSSGDHYKEFSALSIDYIPLIGGTHAKWKGQYQKVSQTINTKASRDKEVFMSDSPKYVFKGALLVAADAGFKLAPQFINLYTLRVAPYGEHQAWAVWNQYNRIMRKFVDANIDGLQTDKSDDDFIPDLPSMFHQYKFRDINKNTTDGADQVKYFQLLHFEQDPFLSAWKGTFHETFDTAIAKTYTDTREFKLITE